MTQDKAADSGKARQASLGVHYHSCPRCYTHAPCTLDCAIEADLSEGWNPDTQEFERPFGATTVRCAIS